MKIRPVNVAVQCDRSIMNTLQPGRAHADRHVQYLFFQPESRFIPHSICLPFYYRRKAIMCHRKAFTPIRKTLFIAVIFLAIGSGIHAQSASQNSYWINFGLGAIGNTGAYYQTGRHVFSIRYGVSGEILGDTYSDIGLLYGWSTKPALFTASIGTGIAYSTIVYDESGLFGSQSDITKNAIGVPLEIQLYWRFTRFVGLGLYTFANFNSEKSFAGVTICVQAGKLR